MTELTRITTQDINKATGGKASQPVQTIENTRARTRKPVGKYKLVLEALLVCPKCYQNQWVYMYTIEDKPWIKCDHCGELIPRDAWGCLAYGNPGPLSSNQ